MFERRMRKERLIVINALFLGPWKREFATNLCGMLETPGSSANCDTTTILLFTRFSFYLTIPLDHIHDRSQENHVFWSARFVSCITVCEHLLITYWCSILEVLGSFILSFHIMKIARVYADAFIKRNKQLIQYSEVVKRELGAVHKKSSREDHRHQGIRIGEISICHQWCPCP